MLTKLIHNFHRRNAAFLAEEKRKMSSALFYREKELFNPGNYYSKHSFDYYKCIFIHIPKTAGISISKTLFGHYTDHSTVDWYVENYNPATFKNYFKFAFVRNPWDRLYSAYSFLKKGGMYAVDADFYDANLSHLKNFKEFVLNWLNHQTITSISHFLPQYLFITSKEDRNLILVDFVGRFEKIEEDFNIVAKQLRFERKQLERSNVTNCDPRRYIEMYDNEMIEKVRVLYQRDIEMFNYSFE